MKKLFTLTLIMLALVAWTIPTHAAETKEGTPGKKVGTKNRSKRQAHKAEKAEKKEAKKEELAAKKEEPKEVTKK